MSIARKIKAAGAQSSMIRKMFEEGAILKKKFGADKVYDFSLGNPNVEPPEKFRQELQKLAQEIIANKHGYMPNAGYMETRQFIADKINKMQGLKLAGDHVIMSCGAGGALNVIFKALLDPQDEVIVPVPFFMEYNAYVDNYGGVLRKAKTRDDFSLDVAAIAAAVNDKTKAVLINSPNNPTGKVYSTRNITDLARMLDKKSNELQKTIYLVSDEPYSEIVYDNVKVPNIFTVYKNSIIAYSYSKTLSLPGERIGYIAVNPEIEEASELLNALILCTRISGFVNAPALMQRIIARLQDVKVDVDVYKRKRDLLCSGLGKAGYKFEKPQGAFYLFVQSPIADDVAFVQSLLKKNILVVPGSAFGSPGYFRIAYCVDDAAIVNSIAGFAEAIKECQ
ncbi:MAG: aspartate aminotransferase [Deltaproteobacteria bacterium HGW-Deltaproteobacteria-12]|jgi:aspartate aminotransferase|nr:MAG: aspartate aminotransferase [Deltaproteobacteria bacterium HGW-Deltaproteobacteria-12]